MTILGERCALSRPVRGTGERFPQGGPLGESPPGPYGPSGRRPGRAPRREERGAASRRARQGGVSPLVYNNYYCTEAPELSSGVAYLLIRCFRCYQMLRLVGSDILLHTKFTSS